MRKMEKSPDRRLNTGKSLYSHNSSSYGSKLTQLDKKIQNAFLGYIGPMVLPKTGAFKHTTAIRMTLVLASDQCGREEMELLYLPIQLCKSCLA